MKKYTKSVIVAKRERARRKCVLELTDKGLTQAQIATKLGVSKKTVQRDLQKLKRYISKLEFDAKMETTQYLSDRLEQYPTMVRFDLLTDLICVRGNSRREGRLMREALSGQYKPPRRRRKD